RGRQGRPAAVARIVPRPRRAHQRSRLGRVGHQDRSLVAGPLGEGPAGGADARCAGAARSAPGDALVARGGTVAEKGAAKTNPPLAAVLALKPAPQKDKPAPRPQRWEDAVAVVTVRGDLDRDALEAIDYAVSRACTDAG